GLRPSAGRLVSCCFSCCWRPLSAARPPSCCDALSCGRAVSGGRPSGGRLSDGRPSGGRPSDGCPACGDSAGCTACGRCRSCCDRLAASDGGAPCCCRCVVGGGCWACEARVFSSLDRSRCDV